jgi:hypothetical protein
MRHDLNSRVALSLATLSTAAAAFAAALLTATPARAAIETWVSGTGVDAGNLCAITAPCRTFAYALTKTGNGGTINVLTSGNFGPVTINKSVSIVADGVEALINTTAANGRAIQVAAGNSQVVSLRGLTIDIASGAGIDFVSGAALHVQNCVIRGGIWGILVGAGGTRELYVSDTVISKAGFFGVLIQVASTVRAVLNRVRVENNATGAYLGQFNAADVSIVIRNSVFAGNAEHGIEIVGEDTTVTVDRSAIVNNGGAGISTSVGIARIGDSTVTGNTTGLEASGGTIQSYGTNKIDGNGADTAGTITPIDMK